MPIKYSLPVSLRRLLFPFLALTIPLAIRALPEILMGQYPTGFDPMGYYIPAALTWLRGDVDFWHQVATAPLFYIMLAKFVSLGSPITLTLKVMSPVLHGLLSLSIYLYVNRGLKWPSGKSLCAALLATLYFVAMRISWDLLRNQLGLIFLFLTLTLLRGRSGWRRVLMSITASLVVLSHELVSVVMFIILLATIVHELFKGERKEACKLVIMSVPSALLFLLVLYLNFRSLAGLVGVFRFPKWEAEGAFSLHGFHTYEEMVVTASGFLAWCYLPLTPLALKGAKNTKNLQLRAWTLFCLIASLLPVGFAIFWYRWALMLIYPLSLYAAEAVSSIKYRPRRICTSFAFGVITAILASGFIAMPCDGPFPYYAIPRFWIYVPSSMLQNTVALKDCPNVVDCLEWLRQNMDENSTLLAHTAFHGWALLYLDTDQILPYGYGNPETAAEQALEQGYTTIYLIWWIQGKGWHGQPTVPPSFKEVYRSGDIAVYAYCIRVRPRSSPDVN